MPKITVIPLGSLIPPDQQEEFYNPTGSVTTRPATRAVRPPTAVLVSRVPQASGSAERGWLGPILLGVAVLAILALVLLFSGSSGGASVTSAPTVTAAAPQPAQAAPAVQVAPRRVAATSTPGGPRIYAASGMPAVVAVGNTDREGVYIRRTPYRNDMLRPWPDGTRLRTLGRMAESDGWYWVEVVDPAGNRGWVPRQYVVGAR